MKRFAAFLMALLIGLSACPAVWAEESLSRQQYYEKGLEELYDFDPECLQNAADYFTHAGIYARAKDYRLYAEALLKICNAQEDPEGLDEAEISLTLLGEDSSFTEELAEKGYPGCEELITYIYGRKLEYYGDAEGALELYGTLDILDARQRSAGIIAQQRAEKYELAKGLFDEGKLCEALLVFEQLGKYRDSSIYYKKAKEQARHDWDDASCTTPKTCRICKTTEGEALGHQWKEANCTSPKTCTVCGVTDGEALGHQWKEADCTSPKTCAVCGETEGEALGHQWKKATCTEAQTCTRCGMVSGSALGHNWKDATCTEAKKCTRCGTVSGSALGHNWKDATYNTPRTCTRCGKTDGKALSLKCTFKNTSGISVTEVYVFPDGYSNIGKARNKGWIYNGGSEELSFTAEEAKSSRTYTLRILQYWKYGYYWVNFEGLRINDFLGKTIEFYSLGGSSVAYKIY